MPIGFSCIVSAAGRAGIAIFLDGSWGEGKNEKSEGFTAPEIANRGKLC